MAVKKLTEADLNKTRVETLEHIRFMQRLLNSMAKEIMDRGVKHDQSKLESPELEVFAEVDKDHSTQDIRYGTPEYQASLDALKPALEHHYAANRHHPQHFKNGVNDMNLIDLIEMLCDWKASSTRYKGGNIRTSIEHNGARFGLSPQLVKILENTADMLGNKD